MRQHLVVSYVGSYVLPLQEGDFTWLHTVAQSLVNLQSTFGTIPNIYGQGHAAKIVEELTNTMISEFGERKTPQHKIGHLVIIDRDVDYVTPLCSQVKRMHCSTLRWH